MSRRVILATGALLLTGVLAAGPVAANGPGSVNKPVRNVILMIDDGAGYNTHLIGSLYDKGEAEAEVYNDFPFRYAGSTYSRGVALPCGDPVGYDPAAAWGGFGYVLANPTDSAASGTAMATGVKTYDAAIGMDCDGHALQNLTELFEANDRSTGVVTSVPFDHATPASFVAHNPNRDNYTAIASEMLNSSATDVIMGGGHPFYTKYGLKQVSGTYSYITKADYAALAAGTAGGDANGDGIADPWTFVQTRAQFQALTTGDTPSRVFGMAQVRQTLQEQRMKPGQPVDPEPYTLPFLETVPTLTEMATGALNVLDNDEDGFFLMVEGGATDWAAHDNRKGLMIEEEIAFDRAVEAVLAWVDLNSNWGETMVIVASDHETGYVTGPGSGDTPDGPVWTPVVNNGAGVTPGFEYHSGDHTNSLVPYYVKGAAGRLLHGLVDGTDPVHGRYVDNTDIHALIVGALGL